MNYNVEIDIYEQKERVAMMYVDRVLMHTWEKGLIAIIDKEKTLFEKGSKGQLIFSINDKEMLMDVSVEANDLPHSITQVFSVTGVKNRCISHFIDVDTHTKWVMEVSFAFDEDPHIAIKHFYEKTKTGMLAFKEFVEGVATSD